VAEALLYKEINATIYIKAEGHITAALCADLRERFFSRLNTEPRINTLYVNLSKCEYMDSTFIGLLIGFNKQLIRFAKKSITIVQPSETTYNLLEDLGLTTLLEIVDTPIPFPEDMENIIQTKKTGVDLLLTTHENLMEVSEENKNKFASLHKALKEQQKSSKK
jgi:anti-anti-sigma factor